MKIKRCLTIMIVLGLLAGCASNGYNRCMTTTTCTACAKQVSCNSGCGTCNSGCGDVACH